MSGCTETGGKNAMQSLVTVLSWSVTYLSPGPQMRLEFEIYKILIKYTSLYLVWMKWSIKIFWLLLSAGPLCWRGRLQWGCRARPPAPREEVEGGDACQVTDVDHHLVEDEGGGGECTSKNMITNIFTKSVLRRGWNEGNAPLGWVGGHPPPPKEKNFAEPLLFFFQEDFSWQNSSSQRCSHSSCWVRRLSVAWERLWWSSVWVWL